MVLASSTAWGSGGSGRGSFLVSPANAVVTAARMMAMIMPWRMNAPFMVRGILINSRDYYSPASKGMQCGLAHAGGGCGLVSLLLVDSPAQGPDGLADLRFHEAGERVLRARKLRNIVVRKHDLQGDVGTFIVAIGIFFGLHRNGKRDVGLGGIVDDGEASPGF